MLAATENKKRVAVIGGGLLGLEAANGLLKRGVDVTVIHDMPCLMNRQLDAEAAHLLQKQLETNGMKSSILVIFRGIFSSNGRTSNDSSIVSKYWPTNMIRLIPG